MIERMFFVFFDFFQHLNVLIFKYQILDYRNIKNIDYKGLNNPRSSSFFIGNFTPIPL